MSVYSNAFERGKNRTKNTLSKEENMCKTCAVHATALKYYFLIKVTKLKIQKYERRLSSLSYPLVRRKHHLFLCRNVSTSTVTLTDCFLRL